MEVCVGMGCNTYFQIGQVQKSGSRISERYFSYVRSFWIPQPQNKKGGWGGPDA